MHNLSSSSSIQNTPTYPQEPVATTTAVLVASGLSPEVQQLPGFMERLLQAGIPRQI